MAGKEWFLGDITEKELKTANEKLQGKFRECAKEALLSCAEYLQLKLPLSNSILQSMAVLSPTYDHSKTVPKLTLRDLPNLVPNMFLLKKKKQEAGEETG